LLVDPSRRRPALAGARESGSPNGGIVRIFVSSTLLDLREAREQVTRYLSIITTDVLAMEFFGSDDTAPLDYCLSQVDRADVFVGIYAMRYGSVDPTQHRSITELEYRRAFERMRRGQLRLLLYALASDAEWRVDLVETDPESMRKLAEFKSTLSSRHTLKYFRTTDELPLYVLRDVLGIVGIGSSAALKPAPIQPIAPLPLSRPLQMEYYTEDLRDSFFRNPAICDDLFAQSTNERVGLLVGPSGVGKTSLVNAALFPALHAIGWASASARPFAGTPVGAQVWGQLMKGECPQGLSLLEVLVSAAAAHEGRGVVVFLDQFEDLLKHDSALVEEVSDALWHIHSHGPQNLRVLIAYRSDFEAELGSLWQRVSGAAPGLPRVYLSALTRAEASDALSGTLRILGMEADPSLVSSIVADLETQSSLSGHRGVYPPFVQMVVGALFESAGPRTADLASRYGLLGGAGGIISNYLIDSLQYFVGDDAVAARSILIALSSSRGLKSRRTEHQLGGDTRLPPARLAAVLERLVGMRLVRRQNAEYEISHDLLARKVVEELATTDEIEAKRFKELLAARANAFGVTGECLTTTEILYLYRYRSAIAVDEKEGRLLLASHLKNEGPIAYWIRQFPRDAVLAWIGEQSYDPDGRGRWAPLVDLYRMDEAITTSELARAGSYYADPADFDLRGRMLSAAVASDDLSQLLGFASRKTWMDSCSELIRACCDAVVESPEQGVQLLLRSRSAFVSRHRWEIVSRAAAILPGQCRPVDRSTSNTGTARGSEDGSHCEGGSCLRRLLTRPEGARLRNGRPFGEEFGVERGRGRNQCALPGESSTQCSRSTTTRCGRTECRRRGRRSPGAQGRHSLDQAHSDQPECLRACGTHQRPVFSDLRTRSLGRLHLPRKVRNEGGEQVSLGAKRWGRNHDRAARRADSTRPDSRPWEGGRAPVAAACGGRPTTYRGHRGKHLLRAVDSRCIVRGYCDTVGPWGTRRPAGPSVLDQSEGSG
jgi:hypothetical protein